VDSVSPAGRVTQPADRYPIAGPCRHMRSALTFDFLSELEGFGA
jgi:hypothetical protein